MMAPPQPLIRGTVRHARRLLRRMLAALPGRLGAPGRFPLLPATAAVAGLALVVLATDLFSDLQKANGTPAGENARNAGGSPGFADKGVPPAPSAFDWETVEPAAGPDASVAPPRGTAPTDTPELPAPTSLPPVPPAPPELADVALELQQRREQLLELEARLAIREAGLRTAEAGLAAQLDRLEALRGELQALVGMANDEEEARQQQLVKVYESMRAKSAAQIFDRLDLAVLLPVAKRMKEAKMAAILAAMDPGRARIVTTELAREQNLPTLP